MSTITVRVPKKVKQKLKKYNVNVSETVRIALDKCLETLERKDLEEKLDQLKTKTGKKIDANEFAKIIREERESH
jgi:Arc/MetJ-type ribon-helix-helix transcriptional regulator